MATPFPESLYAITIDFQKDSPDPTRVFRSMTSLIEAFTGLDKELAQSIDVHVTPIILLEDIEAGSLKVWLRTVLEAIDDTGLKEADWKKIVGRFLLQAKYRIIDWTNGRTTVTSRTDIQQLEAELLRSAEGTDVTRLPMYMPVPEDRLLKGIQSVSQSLKQLSKSDRAQLETPEGSVGFNLDFSITPESIRALLVKESIPNEMTMILKIKKPDYLGESMWEFKHENHAIQARIVDSRWLSKFQSRAVEVRPQDALRARVTVTAHYGYDGEVVDVDYVIVEVLEVIQGQEPEQGVLLYGPQF